MLVFQRSCQFRAARHHGRGLTLGPGIQTPRGHGARLTNMLGCSSHPRIPITGDNTCERFLVRERERGRGRRERGREREREEREREREREAEREREREREVGR